MTYLENYVDNVLGQWEGDIPWMYRDSSANGWITTGKGSMLPNVDAALALPFQVNGAAATAAQINSAFCMVQNMPPGRAAAFYRFPGCPVLLEADIDALSATAVAGAERSLQAKFPGFDAFPDGAKTALLDMEYNMGPGGLDEFHHLALSVVAGQWGQAALQCHRMQISAARNAWTAQQFNLAAAA